MRSFRAPRFGWSLPLPLLLVVGCANALGVCTEPVLNEASTSSTSATGGEGGNGGHGDVDAYRAAVLADGPIAYFTLDEPASPLANLVDGSLPAVGTAGVHYAKADPLGLGLGFDGKGGTAVVGDDYDFLGTHAMSVELWAAIDGVGTFQHLLEKRTPNPADADGWSLTIEKGGPLDFSRVEGGNYRHAKGPVPPRFAHIVGTFDGHLEKLYIDAQLQSPINDIADGASLQKNEELFRIGGGASGSNFSGTIDEVAIYDKALTAEQVAAHRAASGL